MGLAGGLIGTKRVAMLAGLGSFDARSRASRRKMKISDSIGRAPWFGARSLERNARGGWTPPSGGTADIVGANTRRKSA
jgi:hypothetical protein